MIKLTRYKTTVPGTQLGSSLAVLVPVVRINRGLNDSPTRDLGGLGSTPRLYFYIFTQHFRNMHMCTSYRPSSAEKNYNRVTTGFVNTHDESRTRPICESPSS